MREEGDEHNEVSNEVELVMQCRRRERRYSLYDRTDTVK